MRRYKRDINPETGRFEIPITHDGRPYVLFKREQSPTAPWYLRVEHKGKSYWRSTNTADAELAKNKAGTLIAAILNDDRQTLDATKLRNLVQYATVGQVCSLYERLATVVRPRGPVNTLRLILRTVHDQIDVERLTVDKLTAKTVRDYQAAVVSAVRHKDLDTSEYRAALRSAQFNANSIWNQARSVFIAPMMSKYRDAGLAFPAGFEADFVAAPKIPGVKRPMYIQPHDGLIRRTFEAHERTMAAAARLGYAGAGDLKDQRSVAVILELGCALRAAEVRAVRGEWLGEIDGRFCLTLPANETKDIQPVHIHVPPEWENYLRHYVLRRGIGPKDRLVPSGETVTRAVSKWLRKLGWKGSKTNHALRKWFGFWVATKFGFGVAQPLLRHKQIATTQNYYTGILKTDKVVVTFAEVGPKAEEKIVSMKAS